MNRLRWSVRWFLSVALILSSYCLPPVVVRAEVVTLNSGMQLRGRLTRVSSLNQNPLLKPKGGNVDVAKIVLVDDDLRRTFVSSNQVRTGGLAAEGDVVLEEIEIPKRVAQVGRRIGSVGPIIEVTKFDQYGNRIFSMQSLQGRIDVVQGITLINPLYTKVEGLLVRRAAFVWDMRVSTASIPRETLTKTLMRQIDQTDPRDRLRVVTLYLQAKRYHDALIELNRVIQDFPDLKELVGRKQRLHQLVATDVIREIELRAKAGQHQLSRQLLTNFPEKDVAQELLLKVDDLLGDYDKYEERRKKVLGLLSEYMTAMAGHRFRLQIAAMSGEIQRELNINNMDRMADFLRLADDEKLGTDQKLSLAFSGWLLGSGSAIENLAESLSLIDVRAAVREYLRATNQMEREKFLQTLRELEGSSPANIAKIIATMYPPLDVQLPTEGVPGLLELRTPGMGGEEFRYYVQVPPEYDPSRRYPCIVTLNGNRTMPLDQIDWWAGGYSEEKRMRVGQATRYGYFVIAPEWTKPNQSRCEYSLREHAAVLRSLRDACRRFSIDSDRVFLSGHSMGGDAAWDIGLAHPDLWAGVLPIAATSDKYITRYWKNARGLPMYFVAGQMDGNKIARNARDLDRYLKYAGFDVTYVEYKGRGEEHFHDEILRLFDWMNLYRRDFGRREFEVAAMRPWDRFFWWVELDGYPDRLIVLPENWPQSKSKEAETEANVSRTNGIRVKTPALGVTVWLAPEFIDFTRPVSYGGRKVDATPNIEVLLDDVRTRSDRQHPFWGKIRPATGRRR